MASLESIEDLGDLYSALGIPIEATDKEICKAYRKLSLAVHPDRNKDDPNAAEKFDKLTRTKDFLLNPTNRHLYDEKVKAVQSRNLRFKELDAKNQRLRTDLERREEAATRAKEREKEVKVPTHIKEDYKRIVEERKRRKQEQQDSVEKRLRQTVAANAKVSVHLKSTMMTHSALALKLQEILQPFRLLRAEVEDFIAELTFGSREDALEATLFLKREKTSLGFLKKVVVKDACSSTEDTLEELGKMVDSL